jgi:hypothetical protein
MGLLHAELELKEYVNGVITDVQGDPKFEITKEIRVS